MKGMSRMKRAAAIVLTMLSLSSAVPANAAHYVWETGVYKITTLGGMAMNDQFADGEGGAIVCDPFDEQAHELWIIRQWGSTQQFTISPYSNPDLYLSGENGKGGGLTLSRGSDGNTAFRWTAARQSNGTYVIKNVKTGWVIDCENGRGTVVGNRFLLWEENNYADAQHLNVIRLSEKTDTIRPGSRVSAFSRNDVTIRPFADTNKCLNVQYASAAVGAAVVLDTASGELHERFNIVARNGVVSIHPLHAADLCLAPSGAESDRPIVLKRYDSNDPSCHWEVYSYGQGYSFRNHKTKLMLDNYCNRTHDGNPLIAYSYTGGADPQGFYIQGGNGTSAAGANTSNRISNRLNEMVNGQNGYGGYRSGTTYRGRYASEQCKGFAKDVFQSLFGYNIGSTAGKPNNYKINYDSGKTIEVGTLTNLASRSDQELKALLSRAYPGSFLQVRRNHGGSHSMIVLSVNDSGVTVYEANVDGKNSIRTATYRWDQFRASNTAVGLYTPRNYNLVSMTTQTEFHQF